MHNDGYSCNKCSFWNYELKTLLAPVSYAHVVNWHLVFCTCVNTYHFTEARSVPTLLISCKPVTNWVMKDLTILLVLKLLCNELLSDMEDEIDSYLQQWLLYHNASILNLQ